MGRVATILTVLLFNSFALAQAKVDRVPNLVAPPEFPTKPNPSDDVSDAPASEQAEPEIAKPYPEPDTRLVIGAPDSDTLKGHLVPYAGVGYTMVFGRFDTQTAAKGTLASSLELALGLGYGLSRNVDIGVAALYAPLSSGTDCADCSAKAIDSVVYVGYHLVQGTRFDPWVRFGTGLSMLRLSTAGTTFNYVGMNWAHATIGGDWYATNRIGIGPIIDFSLQSYFQHPAGSSTAIAERFTLGLRLTFDPASHK